MGYYLELVGAPTSSSTGNTSSQWQAWDMRFSKLNDFINRPSWQLTKAIPMPLLKMILMILFFQRGGIGDPSLEGICFEKKIHWQENTAGFLGDSKRYICEITSALSKKVATKKIWKDCWKSSPPTTGVILLPNQTKDTTWRENPWKLQKKWHHVFCCIKFDMTPI